MIYNFKVRFHLKAGKNFLNWQVTDLNTKEVKYYDPKQVTLAMINCRLVNRVATAKLINDGAHKAVCAWIECNDVIVSFTYTFIDSGDSELLYNPRNCIHWQVNHGNGSTSPNVDKLFFNRLFTANRRLKIS